MEQVIWFTYYDLKYLESRGILDILGHGITVRTLIARSYNIVSLN